MRDSDKLTAAVTALTEGGDHSSPLVRMARSVQVFALPPNRKPMSSARLKTEKERSGFLTFRVGSEGEYRTVMTPFGPFGPFGAIRSN